MRDYLAVFIIAAVTSLLITGPVKWLALRINAVDHPSERKVHTEIIPRLGGAAIFLGFAVALIFQLIFQDRYPSEITRLHLSPELKGLLIGAAIIFVVGVIDDIYELPPLAKLGGQIVAASVLVGFGIKMEFIGNPISGGVIYLGNLGIVLTVIWVVAFINIINFIDGLDGLAAGVAGIAAASFAFFAWQTGQIGMVVISMAIAGSCLGFLRHNFNPAKIFMGDSGSMFLGFLFGAITVDGVMKSIAAIALLAPLVIMGVPILDGALAVLRRYRGGKPVTQADNDHLHHRLLRRGFSHRQAVVVIYLWSIALSAFGLTMRVSPSSQKYLIILFMLFLSYLFAEFVGVFDFFNTGAKHRARKRRDRSDRAEEEVEPIDILSGDINRS